MAGQVCFRAQLGRLYGPGLGNRHADGIRGDVSNVVFVVEDDLVEEGSVEDASFSRFASGVDVAEVGEDLGELVEAFAGVLVAGGEVLQSVFDGVEVGADAVLFVLEEVEWDGVGVVGLDELESLGVELLLLRVRERTFVIGGGFELIEDGAEDFADTIGLGGREPVGPGADDNCQRFHRADGS